MAGFDRFGLRLQSDYSRLKIVIDQQRFCNRFSKIEPAVELFLRPRPRSDEHGHGNSEIFFFLEKKFCSLKKIKKKIRVEDSDITTKVYWAREAQMEDIRIWKAVSITTFPCICYVFHMGFGYGPWRQHVSGVYILCSEATLRGKATYTRYLCFATRNVTFFGRELPAGRQQDNLMLSLLP